MSERVLFVVIYIIVGSIWFLFVWHLMDEALSR